MNNKYEEKRKKDRKREIIIYTIIGVLWLGGLTMCILGFFAYNSPVPYKYNSIYQAELTIGKAFGGGGNKVFDFRIWGAVVCLVMMVIFLIFVHHYANKYERDQARRSKQEARLQRLLEKDKLESEKAIERIKENQISLNVSAPSSAPAPMKGEDNKKPQE